MIRGALSLALLCCATAALAQEDAPRPPERPAEAEAASAPPPKPEGDTPAEQEPEAEDAAGIDDPDEAATDEAEFFGPPMPPMHARLRETDQEFAACRLALSLLGTVYEDQPAATDPEIPDCGIARPIRVSQIIPGVELEGGALMRCSTARALGFWTRDFLRPAAAALPGAPQLQGMQLGTTYDCRGRVGSGDGGDKLSEHAFGNAIDIMGFHFDQAEPLPVQPRDEDGDAFEAFQKAARASACLWFTTVLGPGSNAAHEDHLHLDMAQRSSGWRLCD